MSTENQNFENSREPGRFDQESTQILNIKRGYTFSSKQQHARIEGRKKRNALIRATQEAAERAKGSTFFQDDKMDTILSGSTGIGKTFNCERALSQIGLKRDKDYVLFTGNNSMLGFALKLMLSHRHFLETRKSTEERLIVMVDDCDTFFADKVSRDTLKRLLASRGNRVFQYDKIVPVHMMNEVQLQALEFYMNKDGSPGFKIPCDDIAFIFTTNFIFPTEAQAKYMLDKNGPTNRANAFQDLAALRSRAKTKDFMLEKDVNWGWIVEVALADGLLDMLDSTSDPDFNKWLLLNWVLTNWDHMTEHNLRTISDMGRMMIRFPESFQDEWEADFTKDSSKIL